jgi:hypothetical protein
MDNSHSVSVTGLFARDVYLGTLPNYHQTGNCDYVNADSDLVT